MIKMIRMIRKIKIIKTTKMIKMIKMTQILYFPKLLSLWCDIKLVLILNIQVTGGGKLGTGFLGSFFLQLCMLGHHPGLALNQVIMMRWEWRVLKLISSNMAAGFKVNLWKDSPPPPPPPRPPPPQSSHSPVLPHPGISPPLPQGPPSQSANDRHHSQQPSGR